jgi:antitoxin (DNA-binding transcriptional repressor) of toxin-antitoxin stability system
MAHISIRDLQRLSAETIGALPGPTTVKSGGRPVALLVPLKAADPDRLAAVLTRAEALAKGRDPAADDAVLAPFGDLDPVDWSVEAVRGLTAGPARG